MPTLHIINTSPNSRSGLASCLGIIQEGDGIIFIEDAVIAVKKNTKHEQLLKEKIPSGKCYALKPDLDARGIKLEQISSEVELLDYNGFVRVTTEFARTLTWN